MSTDLVDESRVRGEVRSWLETTWDPELSLLEWRELLVGSGWAVPSWSPQWYGRGLPTWADKVVAEEISRAGAVGSPLGGGTALAAPTIAAHGSDELKLRLLRSTLTGQLKWCQLFSEPGAGSDLAGLATTAVRDGDDWILNGQKVWNTSAHHADLGMLLARTDWDVPKHHGISYFALPMDQAGVEVRPIVQMNGHSSFNEVFLTDARVPASNIIGEKGDGWRVARTTLMHERTFATMRRPVFGSVRSGQAIDEAALESAEHFATYAWYPQRAGRPDLAIAQAIGLDRAGDPVVRQEIARLFSLQRASEWTAARGREARRLGRPPGPEGSLGKLAASEVARMSGKVHTLILGSDGLLADGLGPGHSTIAEVIVSTPAQSIAGGTDEIQRNIIGENILGLPREPAVDRDVPYRDVRR